MATKRNKPASAGATSTPVAPVYTGKFEGLEGRCLACGKRLTPANSSGIGATCKAHYGKPSVAYTAAPPAEWGTPKYISMVAACNLAQHMGHSRGWLVSLAGGDKGINPVAAGFTVYTVTLRGKLRKMLLATCVQAMLALPGLPAGFVYTPSMLQADPAGGHKTEF